VSRDVAGGALWVLLGGAIVLESLRMDRFTAMGATLYTMPGLVPGIFGSALMLLGALLAWRGWRVSRLGAPADAMLAEAAEPTGFNRRVAAMLVLSLVYAAGLIGRAPFVPATFAFMALFMVMFTPADAGWPRRIGVAITTSAITTAIVVLAFERVFLVRLP
jgi:Tripartite tricarboxylate transporter TctB family